MKNAKVIRVNAKCSDLFSMDILDKNKNIIGAYSGYVPDFFPDEHFGDYVMLDIDINTGKILNWVKPSKEQLERLEHA